MTREARGVVAPGSRRRARRVLLLRRAKVGEARGGVARGARRERRRVLRRGGGVVGGVRRVVVQGGVVARGAARDGEARERHRERARHRARDEERARAEPVAGRDRDGLAVGVEEDPARARARGERERRRGRGGRGGGVERERAIARAMRRARCRLLHEDHRAGGPTPTRAPARGTVERGRRARAERRRARGDDGDGEPAQRRHGERGATGCGARGSKQRPLPVVWDMRVWYSNFGAESHERRHGRFPAFKSAPRSVPLLVHGLVLTPRDPFTDPVTSDREEVPRKKKARPRLGTSPLAVSSERPTLRLPPPRLATTLGELPRDRRAHTPARRDERRATPSLAPPRAVPGRGPARGRFGTTPSRPERASAFALAALRAAATSPGTSYRTPRRRLPVWGAARAKPSRRPRTPRARRARRLPRTRVASASSAASASRRARRSSFPGGPPRGSSARSRTRARGALVARRARGGRREGRARGRRRARARRLRGVALPLAPPRAPGRAHALAVVHPPARRRGGPGGGNEALRPRRVSSRRPRTRPRARPPRRRSKRKRPPLDAVASRQRHARRSERGRFWETAKKKRRTNASRRLLAFSPSPRRAVPRGVAALLGRARRLRSRLLALPRVPPRRGLERLAPRPPPPGRIGKRIEKKGHPVGDGRVFHLRARRRRTRTSSGA